MKRHHDHDYSYKNNNNNKKHLIEVVAYSVRGLVHYYHGGEHGGVQTDMGLEKELLATC